MERILIDYSLLVQKKRFNPNCHLLYLYYTYMFDIIKIRFKILFYPRITASNKAQLRDCFVMNQL